MRKLIVFIVTDPSSINTPSLHDALPISGKLTTANTTFQNGSTQKDIYDPSSGKLTSTEVRDVAGNIVSTTAYTYEVSGKLTVSIIKHVYGYTILSSTYTYYVSGKITTTK